MVYTANDKILHFVQNDSLFVILAFVAKDLNCPYRQHQDSSLRSE